MAAVDMDALRTFVSIARLGGFSRAAETLHRSQPAISRRIDLLERALDVPLFERVRGGAMLTDAGEALLPYAEAVLAAAKDGVDAVNALKRGDAGRLSLALVGTLADARLTERLRAFRRRHPNVQLNLQTAASQEVAALVLRGDATLGLRYLVDRSPGLASQIVTREALLVVGHAAHRLADGRRHPPRALAGERWVAFPSRGSRESFVRFLERRLLAAGLEDPDIIPIDSLTAQKRLVEAGFGIALLAHSGIQDELRLGTLRVLDVPALRADIPVSVVHRRNAYLSRAARSLLSMIAASGRQT
ncbi:MAG TPA: LysR family transcriptional regulator [Vineibacter sp.]|nr:LysR family transcriptional regulator [Vineibacter sp.]